MKTLKTLIRSFFIMVMTFLLFTIDGISKDIEFFVSPKGSDAQAGTSANKPFATLQKARDAVRALKQKGELKSPVTVYLLGGTYELSEPFILTADDSGTEACPVTYCAYQNEKPVISGGKAINSSWEKYKGNIMVTTIPEAKDGKWKFRQLFVNGKRMDRARTPDKDNYFRNERTEQDLGRSTMKFREGDIMKWNNPDEVEVVILHSWNESRLFISEINKEERLVTFTGPMGFQLGRYRSDPNRYFVENLLEGLDQPGEWYLDSKSGKLYLYPIDDLYKTQLRVPVINQLVILQGDIKNQKYVQYVKFSGLTFTEVEYIIPKLGIPTLPDVGDIYKPSAITFDGVKFCTFENNSVRNIGSYALEITGDGNKIMWNEIYDAGSGGIITRSYGKERNIISYNHIHDCGKVFFSGVGVNVDDGGGEVAHNLIHDMSQTGVYGRHWRTSYQAQERRNQGQGLIIEYNEIHDVMQKLNDGGGIFIRDSNIIIRNNLIYNVYSPENGSAGFGIYLGCETRYTQVVNNVVYGTVEGLHVWQGSRHNTIENNIFADSEVREVWYQTPEKWNMPDNRFLRNIVYDTKPYSAAFDVQGENSLPSESDNNVIYNTGGRTPIVRNSSKGEVNSWEVWLKRGYEKNSLIADPLFKDPANHDYTLLPDSPALKLGFKQIDISTVGLRGQVRK